MTNEIRCRVCGDVRPDDKISIKKVDESAHAFLPAGTIVTYFRFCSDRPACIAGAEKWEGYFNQIDAKPVKSSPASARNV